MANWLTRIFDKFRNISSNQSPADFLEGVDIDFLEYPTLSQQNVTAETSRNIATAYRCINTISDDVAKLPLQTFISQGVGQVERVKPNARLENIAWLLEVSPNRWMTPFIFKKAVIMWVLTHGAGYVWEPPRRPGRRRELWILPANITRPVFDENNRLWYEVSLPGTAPVRYPDVEVLPLLINSTDGVSGKGVITYARETLGRQLAKYVTQNRIAGKGLNPSGIAWMEGELNKEARKKFRTTYEETMGESGIAIFDKKVAKFEKITMSPVDAQFLESIEENDTEIANFFNFPVYKLNMGKQSYQSNEQQNMDYLNSTLDPYLVQWEQAAALRWLSEEEQNYTYFRFIRDALLRTDAKSRAEVIYRRIFSGVMTPNQALQIEDMPAYEGGNNHYFPSNMSIILPDGSIQPGAGGADETAD